MFDSELEESVCRLKDVSAAISEGQATLQGRDCDIDLPRHLEVVMRAACAAPALSLVQGAADFGRFSNDLENRLPDAFTNAIGLLEHLNREEVARRLQSVAAGWFKELKELRAAALRPQYQQERGGKPEGLLFMEWAERAGLDTERDEHRGHFLSPETTNARTAWRAALAATPTPVATAETGDLIPTLQGVLAKWVGVPIAELLDDASADLLEKLAQAGLKITPATSVATVGSETGGWVLCDGVADSQAEEEDVWVLQNDEVKHGVWGEAYNADESLFREEAYTHPSGRVEILKMPPFMWLEYVGEGTREIMNPQPTHFQPKPSAATSVATVGSETASYHSTELSDISSIITWLHAQNKPMGELLRRFYNDATRGKRIEEYNDLTAPAQKGAPSV